jgi:hypothetical protein
MPAGLHYSIELEEEEANQNRGEDASLPLFPFFVRKENGELIALGEIDREERAQYHFKVKVKKKYFVISRNAFQYSTHNFGLFL